MAGDRLQEPSEQALKGALTILERPDADERAVEEAFKTLTSALPLPPAPKDFARRVVRSVRRAPLPKGRRTLTKPLPPWGWLAMCAATAAAGWAVVAVFGPFEAYAVAGVVQFFVRAGLSGLASLHAFVLLGRAAVTVSGALADALALPALSAALTGTALVGGLSLIALIRLLSREQESSPWPDRPSLG